MKKHMTTGHSAHMIKTDMTATIDATGAAHTEMMKSSSLATGRRHAFQ